MNLKILLENFHLTPPRLIFILFIVLFPIIIILSVSLANRTVQEQQEISESQEDLEANAYFNPQVNQSREVSMTGKIFQLRTPLQNEELDFDINYELVNADGDRLAYVDSEELDLSLTIGIESEVMGKSTGVKQDDLDIVIVDSLRLK